MTLPRFVYPQTQKAEKTPERHQAARVTSALWMLLLVLLLVGCQRQTPAPPPTPTPTLPARPGQPTERPAITSLTPTPAVTPAPEAPTPPPTPVDTGTLVLWHSWSGADADALAQILAGYRENRPAVTVETLFVAYDDLPQAYASAVQAGGGPDLFLAPAWWLQDLVAAQVLLPLDGRLTPDEVQGYNEAALNSLVVNGRLYGLPTNYELVSMYVNYALIEEKDLPSTTEDMISLAQADPKNGAGLYTNFYHLYWGIPAYGGALFDEQGRVILDQTPGTAQFLEWLNRAAQTQGIFASLDYGMLIDRFKKGEYAFFVDGPWSKAELELAIGPDLGVTLLPAGPAGPGRPWLIADGVFLNPGKTNTQQQLALDLARYLTGPESGSVLARVAGRLPAHTSAPLPNDPILEGFVRQAAFAIPEPTRPEMEAVWGPAGDMIIKVLSGAAAPEEAVLEATTLINEANGR